MRIWGNSDRNNNDNNQKGEDKAVREGVHQEKAFGRGRGRL